MGARNRGGIGLSYRTARLHRLAEFIPWNQIPGPHKHLKIRALTASGEGGGGRGEGGGGFATSNINVILSHSHQEERNFAIQFFAGVSAFLAQLTQQEQDNIFYLVAIPFYQKIQPK
jgi:hypothetical protein